MGILIVHIAVDVKRFMSLKMGKRLNVHIVVESSLQKLGLFLKIVHCRCKNGF